METAIQIVWWVGLAGALLATLVILKMVALVLRALKDIYKLSGYTRDAASNLGNNLAHTSKLDGLAGSARTLRQASSTLSAASSSVDQKVEILVGDIS